MSKRALLRMLERERDMYAAERARLIEQVCHLAGRPWNVAPVDAERDLDELFADEGEPEIVQAHHWPE